MILSESMVLGNTVTMRTNNERHLGGVSALNQGDGKPGQNFGDLLMGAIGNTSELQNEAARLMTQNILQPDAVDADDVAIAASKANLSLSLMKSVIDKALRAYSEILNMR